MSKKLKIKNRAVVIRNFCADCAGSPLDVTLCTIFNCDLWPWRIGDPRSKSYKKRVGGVFEGNSFALRETLALGLTLADFLHPTEAAISKTRPLTQENLDEGDGKEVQSEKTIEGVSAVEPKGRAVQPSPEAHEIHEERKRT